MLLKQPLSSLRTFCNIFFVLCCLISQNHANSQALSISQNSDLIFGSAPQGDGPKVVPPGTTETSENASFDVKGKKNTTYVITLPSTAINMTTGSGSTAQQRISVSNFTSNPASNGLLNNQGRQFLYIGATRAALLFNQTVGSYSGSFQIIVVY